MHQGTRDAGKRTSPGAWSLVCGAMSVVGVAMIGQATYAWIPALDPPGWLRILTMWMLPLGVVVAVPAGAWSVRSGSRRGLGLAGLTLASLSAAAFVALIASAGY